jgi:hypothetical protein
VSLRFPKVSALRDPAGLRARLAELGCGLPCDEELLPPSQSPLGQPLALRRSTGGAHVVANRFVIQPMEGWDGTEAGEPSELTRRRWRRFGMSGAGWTYLQEFIPHVAQACLDHGWFDAVGLGRMALAYPELPADLLAGRPLDRGRICRTFSDCTTAPRSGLVSGCYPLDAFYKERAERQILERVKCGMRRGTSP